MATTDDPRTTTSSSTRTGVRRERSPLFSSLIGLAALGVILQGLWAALFIREGKAYDDSWVGVHAKGAEISIALAAIATVVAFVQLRRTRRGIVIGSAVFTVLLTLEAYIGGLVADSSASLLAIHIPLAMALVGLAVWLPVRASQRA